VSRLALRFRNLSREISPLLATALAYLGGITLAEVLTTFTDPRLGMLLHCLLFVGMLFQSAITKDETTRSLVVSLIFAPMIRILSLALPLTAFPTLYWYLLTSIPLFIALVIAGNALGFSWADLGLNFRRWFLQILIAASGFLFGWVEYIILRPDPMIPSLNFVDILWPTLVFLICTGLLEEMIFRGLIQQVAEDGLGRWGVLYVAVLFAVLHIGYQSLLDVLFVFGVGLFFGWAVKRTGSLIGVTLSHGFTNVALFLIVPFLV
jgi:membrane protease YdiL (CAAX protease family)